MYDILEEKANQVADFKQKLIDCEKCTLTEGTYDLYWASGLRKIEAVHTKEELWPGLNRLGVQLKKLTEKIKDSSNKVQTRKNRSKSVSTLLRSHKDDHCDTDSEPGR